MKVSDLSPKKTEECNLPVLTAGIENQGLNNYAPRLNATVLKNVISISANGANTGVTFYQNQEFTVLQDAYAMAFKDSFVPTDNQYLFLTSAIKKSIYGNFAWTDKAGWEKVKKEKIQLPTKNGEIDFDFMDKFAAELEAQRVAELESYLTVTGLKDYILTEEEKAIINRDRIVCGIPEKITASLDEKLQNVQWGEYRIGDLFDIEKTLSFNSDRLVDGSDYDYITRTSFNQGILRSTGFVNRENLNSSGVWSLGLIGMDFFYRSKEWYAGQFIRKIVPKIRIPQKAILFFTVMLNTLQNRLKSVLVRNVDEVFRNSTIQLPTKNGEIDFDFIETLTKAIQKLVIKDVVEWADRKICATKQVIGNEC